MDIRAVGDEGQQEKAETDLWLIKRVTMIRSIPSTIIDMDFSPELFSSAVTSTRCSDYRLMTNH
jgi:hypothetical protein